MSRQQNFCRKRRRLLGVIATGPLLQSCGGGDNPIASPNGEPPAPPQPPTVNPISLSELSKKTIYIAHRGGAATYPENTYTAYDGALAAGETFLETDVQTLSDGSLGLMHDTDVARTTTSQGNVNTFSKAQWQEINIDSNVWHGSNFGNSLHPPLFSEWVNRYQNRAILVPEDKDLKSTSSMVEALNETGINKDQVLFQSFSLAPLKNAVQNGYSACFLHYGGQDPNASIEAGVKWAGIEHAATDANIRKWVASGIKILIWTVNRRYIRDAKLQLGVTGFFSDDPTYLKRNEPLRTTDNFASQTWLPGMLSSASDFSHPSRGKFLGGDHWGYDTQAANYYGCLQGYLCPIKGTSNPSTYMIKLQITFDGAIANDSTRWASVFIGIEDRPYIDSSNDETSGYHILFRKNGRIQLYKKSAGSAPNSLGFMDGAAIGDGEEVSYRVTVTASSILVTRMNSEGIDLYTLTCNDATTRGGYLQLGRSGLACKFRNVSIS